VAAYRSCGFTVEGRLRETLFRDDSWHDDLAMAILAPEWAENDEDPGSGESGGFR